MHMFCIECERLCHPPEEEPLKCIQCSKTPIRIVKMGPELPMTIKSMFTPISEEINQYTRDLTRVLTFQHRQRASLSTFLERKVAAFDRLRDAYSEEKTKKEHYKKQLEEAYHLLKSKEHEISKLKKQLAEQAPPPQTPPRSNSLKVASSRSLETPSMMRVFSDSMYETPVQIQRRFTKAQAKAEAEAEAPAKSPGSKAQTTKCTSNYQSHPPASFETPIHHPPKTSMGFTTPANPPHMFPYLKKHEAQREKHKEHRNSQ